MYLDVVSCGLVVAVVVVVDMRRAVFWTSASERVQGHFLWFVWAYFFDQDQSGGRAGGTFRII